MSAHHIFLKKNKTCKNIKYNSERAKHGMKHHLIKGGGDDDINELIQNYNDSLIDNTPFHGPNILFVDTRSHTIYIHNWVGIITRTGNLVDRPIINDLFALGGKDNKFNYDGPIKIQLKGRPTWKALGPISHYLPGGTTYVLDYYTPDTSRKPDINGKATVKGLTFDYTYNGTWYNGERIGNGSDEYFRLKNSSIYPYYTSKYSGTWVYDVQVGEGAKCIIDMLNTNNIRAILQSGTRLPPAGDTMRNNNIGLLTQGREIQVNKTETDKYNICMTIVENIDSRTNLTVLADAFTRITTTREGFNVTMDVINLFEFKIIVVRDNRHEDRISEYFIGLTLATNTNILDATDYYYSGTRVILKYNKTNNLATRLDVFRVSRDKRNVYSEKAVPTDVKTGTRFIWTVIIDGEAIPFLYYGTLKNDMPHGSGVSIADNGTLYVGNWTNGCFDGKGTFIRPYHPELLNLYEILKENEIDPLRAVKLYHGIFTGWSNGTRYDTLEYYQENPYIAKKITQGIGTAEIDGEGVMIHRINNGFYEISIGLFNFGFLTWGVIRRGDGEISYGTERMILLYKYDVRYEITSALLSVRKLQSRTYKHATQSIVKNAADFFSLLANDIANSKDIRLKRDEKIRAEIIAKIPNDIDTIKIKQAQDKAIDTNVVAVPGGPAWHPTSHRDVRFWPKKTLESTA